MRLNYTPEEILAMHDRNENFHGTQANFKKLQLYQAVKRGLIEIKEHCECVQVVDGYDPNVREKHAVLWMDLSPVAFLNCEEIVVLSSIMNDADNVIITPVDGYTRISFIIQNIWDD